MPNHVHVVFKPLPVTPAVSLRPQLERQETPSPADSLRYHALASIMQSLKGYTSIRANRLLGREGEFWAHESYDHYIRDADECQRIVAYVLNNPVKAGYVESVARVEVELSPRVTQAVSLRCYARVYFQWNLELVNGT